jgi:hypothetical protein
MANTTKLISINTITGEVIGYSNKGVLKDHFNINSRETVVNWFRDTNKIIKEFNGCKYIIYRLDQYIKKP